MKQKDWALIIVVAFVSAVAAFFISNTLISSKRNLEAPTVGKIDSTFEKPSKKYFNEASVDPTQLIQIGDGSNNVPFGSAQ